MLTTKTLDQAHLSNGGRGKSRSRLGMADQRGEGVGVVTRWWGRQSRRGVGGGGGDEAEEEVGYNGEGTRRQIGAGMRHGASESEPDLRHRRSRRRAGHGRCAQRRRSARRCRLFLVGRQRLGWRGR